MHIERTAARDTVDFGLTDACDDVGTAPGFWAVPTLVIFLGGSMAEVPFVV
jgi:hypothetical protein